MPAPKKPKNAARPGRPRTASSAKPTRKRTAAPPAGERRPDKRTTRRDAPASVQDDSRCLENLLANLPGMAFRCLNEPQRPMEFVSEGSLALTDYKPRGLCSKRAPQYGDLIHPDDRQEVWEEVQQAINAGQSYQVEYRIRTRQGKEKWLWEQGKQVEVSDEGIAVLEGFITDVTERKWAEERLLRSEERFRVIAENSTEDICQLDAEGNVTYVSPAVERLFGYSRDEATQMAFADFIAHHARAAATEVFEAALSGVMHQLAEITGRRKDGSEFPLEVSVTPVAEHGQVVGVQGIARDITRRKEAESAELAARRMWQKTFQAMADGICVIDADGTILQCNESMAAFVGKPPEEVVGKKCWEAVHGTSEPVDECPFPRMRRTLKRESVTLQMGGRWIQACVEPMLDENGALARAVHIITDVTERKLADDALRRSESMYKDLVESATDLVFTMNLQGDCLFANRAIAALSGYSPEELQDLNYLDLVVPWQRKRVQRHYMRQYLRRELTSHIEYAFHTREGQVVWLSQNATLVVEGGQVKGFHLIAHDITDRRRAEEELRKSEERYSLAAEAGRTGVWSYRRGARQWHADDNLKRLLGYSPNELPNPVEDISPFIDPRDRGEILRAIRKGVCGEVGRFEVEHRLTAKDGEASWYHTVGMIIRDDAGRVTRIVGTCTDINERKQSEDELRFHSAVADQVWNSIVATDTDFKITYLNRAAEELFGYSLEEVAGESPGLFNAEEQAQAIQSEIYKALSSGERYEGECLNKRKDGSTFLCNFRLSLVKDAVGRAIGYIGVQRDVTARRGVEQALRESEERYRALVDSSNDHIFMLDLEGVYITSNGRVEGFKPGKGETVVGQRIEGVHPPEVAETYRERFQHVLATGESVTFEHAMTGPDGEYAHVDTLYPILRDGVNWAVGGLCRDITPRKRAEQQLLERHAELEQIFAAIPASVIFTDTERRIVKVNRGFTRIFGYEPGEAVGKTARMLHTNDEDFERAGALHFNALLKDVYEVDEFTYRKKSGELFVGETVGTPVRDASGNALGFIGIVQDITERTRVAEALRESEALLRQVLDATPNGIGVKDNDGRYLLVNRTEAEIYGSTPHEMVGRTDLDFARKRHLSEEEARAFRADDREVIDSQEPKSIPEEPYTRRDGEKRWFQTNKVPLTYKGQRCVLGVATDITAHKLAAEKLRKSESRYRLLAENVSDVIWSMDLELRRTYVSPSTTQLRGFSVEEAMDQSLADMLTPESFARIRPVIEEELALEQQGMADPNRSRTLELQVTHKNGGAVWTETTVSFLRNEQGKAIGFVGLTRDITERRQAEKTLRNYQVAVESATEMIAACDTEYRYTMANRAYLESMQPSADEVIGRTVGEIIGEEYFEDTIRPCIDRCFAGIPLTLETEREFPRGGKRMVSISYSPVLAEEGEVVGVMSVIRDVTERRRAEEALRKRERLLNDMGRMARIGGWEHDLRTGEALWTLALYETVDIAPGTRPPGVDEHLDYYEPESRRVLEQAYKRTIETGEPFDLELQGRTAKGRPCWWRAFGEPVYEGDECVGLRGALQDITERKLVEEALTASEERLGLALAGGELGTWDWNVQTGEVVLDERWAEMLGYALEEIVPHLSSWRALLHPDDMPGVEQSLSAHLEGRTEHYEAEYRLRHKSGKWVWVLDKGRVIERDAAGRPLRACGTHLDITRRKRAEEELRASEARFRELFNNISSGVAIYGVADNGNVLVFREINAAGQRISQVTREGVIGKELREVFPEVTKTGLLDVSRRVWKTGEPERLPLTLYQDERITQWVENYVCKLPSGEIVAIYDDVSEREEAARKLRERAEFIETLLDTIPSPVFYKDVEGVYIGCNKAFEEFFGRSRDEIVGKHVYAISPEDIARTYAEKDDELLRHPGRQVYDWRVKRKNGEIRDVVFYKGTFEDAQGAVAGIIGVVLDTTERAQAERRLREAHDRLRALSGRLVEIQEVERRRIARELHDEIGQALTGVKLMLDTIPVGLSRKGARSVAEAQELVDDLMKRVRELSLELRPQMLDDLGLLPALLWHIERFTAQTNIAVDFSHAGLGGRFAPNIETAAYRIVQEALTNVARHAGVGSVYVRVAVDGERLVVSVADEGKGFDLEAADAESQTCGLAGMRERAEALAGHLLLRTAPEQGTFLTVALPLSQDDGGSHERNENHTC